MTTFEDADVHLAIIRDNNIIYEVNGRDDLTNLTNFKDVDTKEEEAVLKAQQDYSRATVAVIEGCQESG